MKRRHARDRRVRTRGAGGAMRPRKESGRGAAGSLDTFRPRCRRPRDRGCKTANCRSAASHVLPAPSFSVADPPACFRGNQRPYRDAQLHESASEKLPCGSTHARIRRVFRRLVAQEIAEPVGVNSPHSGGRDADFRGFLRGINERTTDRHPATRRVPPLSPRKTISVFRNE